MTRKIIDRRGRNHPEHAVDAAAHLMTRYLDPTELFIYTLLRFQTDFRPVVLARSTANLDEFPLNAHCESLVPDASTRDRLARRLVALVHGFGETYEYRLSRTVRAAGCVILHAHFGWAGYGNLAVAAKLGLPLVTTFYGKDVPSKPSEEYDELFRRGSRFICEGPAMAGRLRAAGCPPAKIDLVRIGIDLDQFEFATRDRKTAPFVILQTARFVEKKGIDLSIRALAVARRSLPHAELWLVGDGAVRPELESLAVELGVSGTVRFLGMLTHDEYRLLTRQVHVAIQPSRTAADGDSEGGAPTVISEMQACGVPVVATRHADIPFVVPDPDRLVAEEDVDGLAAALVEIASISDQEYRARTERAREFVEREHDARVVAPRIAAVYREALRDSSSYVD